MKGNLWYLCAWWSVSPYSSQISVLWYQKVFSTLFRVKMAVSYSLSPKSPRRMQAYTNAMLLMCSAPLPVPAPWLWHVRTEGGSLTPPSLDQPSMSLFQSQIACAIAWDSNYFSLFTLASNRASWETRHPGNPSEVQEHSSGAMEASRESSTLHLHARTQDGWYYACTLWMRQKLLGVLTLATFFAESPRGNVVSGWAYPPLFCSTVCGGLTEILCPYLCHLQVKDDLCIPQ